MQTRICRLHAQGDIRIETAAIAAPGPGEVMVAVGAGGICGSDLHYYQHGGFGNIRVQEPIILGHEAAGTVVQIGPGADLAVGDKVALSPSLPCNTCIFCEKEMYNQCLDMQFFGSAMRMPHVQGAFRDKITLAATQCVKANPATPLTELACAEPLAVCLHAMGQSGSTDFTGKRVLVTGAGPIGALCAALAANAGAAEVVITDLFEAPLKIAAQMGATTCLDLCDNPYALAPWEQDKGRFDIGFECSGAAPAIAAALQALRPGATLVQVGISGATTLPLNILVAKEIALRGTHRFHAEFAPAVRLIETRQIDVRPILTGSFPLAEAKAAFEAAGDRRSASKVQLTFDANIG
ncbi:MAG: L-idonate 5-dehydrogenase [Rhodobacteraceae bacterium]|nr:L-idonate 5-dehydrogenase [Paracoccaceae bacterium]